MKDPPSSWDQILFGVCSDTPWIILKSDVFALKSYGSGYKLRN